MPNHVTNRLTVIGTDKQVEEVLDFIKSEEIGYGSIDFNKITPMPKWVYSGNLGRKEEEKYGAENCWYEWCNENWRTKWNAYDQSKIEKGQNTIHFTTAWCGVPKLIQKIAWIFPDIEIEYSFADEDIGQNQGRFEFKDTEVIDSYPKPGSKEAYDLAFEILETFPEEYSLVFNPEIGTYEYKDEDINDIEEGSHKHEE